MLTRRALLSLPLAAVMAPFAAKASIPRKLKRIMLEDVRRARHILCALDILPIDGTYRISFKVGHIDQIGAGTLEKGPNGLWLISGCEVETVDVQARYLHDPHLVAWGRGRRNYRHLYDPDAVLRIAKIIRPLK